MGRREADHGSPGHQAHPAEAVRGPAEPVAPVRQAPFEEHHSRTKAEARASSYTTSSRTLGATLNVQVPSQTPAEYIKDNRERPKKYYRDWRAVNQDRIQLMTCVAHECPYGGRFTWGNEAKNLTTRKHQVFLSQQALEAVELNELD